MARRPRPAGPSREPDRMLTDIEARALEASWREGWAREFPGAEWPGLDQARRLIRLKADTAAAAAAGADVGRRLSEILRGDG